MQACVYKALSAIDYLPLTTEAQVSVALLSPGACLPLLFNIVMGSYSYWEEKLKKFVLSKQVNHHPSEESFWLEGLQEQGDNRERLSLLPTWGSSTACPRAVIMITELSSKPPRTSTPGLPFFPEGRTYSVVVLGEKESAHFGSTYTKNKKSGKKENSF